VRRSFIWGGVATTNYFENKFFGSQFGGRIYFAGFFQNGTKMGVYSQKGIPKRDMSFFPKKG
jgi:hypothetical protein